MEIFNTLNFESKNPGLDESNLEGLSEFLSQEIEAGEIDNGSSVDHTKWVLPRLQIPIQFKELLKHSDGGLIVTGDRAFGYFGKKELREYYLNYEFPYYMPGVLPIALNGGGVFYAYDLRETSEKPEIIAVEAGVLDWDYAYFLGDDLFDVLSKETNIEDEEP